MKWRSVLGWASALALGSNMASAQTVLNLPAPQEAAQPAAIDPATVVENLTSFDTRQAQLRWINGAWQLFVGNTMLKDFGKREADGRFALRLIRELGLTQRGTIGVPFPVLEYWLADGKPPRGTYSGLQMTRFDPGSLQVVEFQGQWCIRDARQTLFLFGNHVEEANRALAIFRRHGFHAVGSIGGATPTMLVFFGGAEGIASRTEAKPTEMQAQKEQAGLFGRGGRRILLPGMGQNNQSPDAMLAGLPMQIHQLAMSQPLEGAMARLGERVAVDWQRVEVRRENGHWLLAQGTQVLGDFGTEERQARETLRILRYYRCTEQRTLGQPNPVFSYFLTAGHAPRGPLFGLRGREIRPDTLTLRQVGEEWVLAEGDQALMHLGPRPEVGLEVLQILQRERVDTLYFAGGSPVPITFLIRTR